MFAAASSTSFAGARLDTALYLDRALRLHVVGKHRLGFDSRFAPPSPVVRDVATIYVMVAGEFAVEDRDASTPALWVMTETELERPVAGARWFRSRGDPSWTIELRVAAGAVRGPIGLAAGPRRLSPSTWTAARALLVATPQPPAAVAALAAGLVADGVLARPPPLTVDEPPALVRLWQSITPAYDAYATSVTIDQVAAASGRSSRQVRRDLKTLAVELDMFGGDFRQIMRILRLRAALLLLSAPEASVNEVADRVGYGTSMAMTRAFRESGLPPPSEIRATVRYPA